MYCVIQLRDILAPPEANGNDSRHLKISVQPPFLSVLKGRGGRLFRSCDHGSAECRVVVEHVVHTALVVDLKLGCLDSELLR